MTHEAKIIGLRLELLFLVAKKYEPDVAALLEEYNQHYDEELVYQSAYQALEGLCSKGFVEKKPIDDRANCYMLTNKGADLLDTHRQLVLDAIESVDDSL